MKKERKNNLKQRIFAMTMAVFTAASPGLSSYLTAYATADAPPATVTSEAGLPAATQAETTVSAETSSTEVQPAETESETERRMQSLNIMINTEGGEVRLNAGSEEEQVVRMMVDEEGSHLNVYDKDGNLLQTVEQESETCFYPYQTDADSIVSVTAKADEGYTLSYYDVTGEETGFSDITNNPFTYPVWLDEEKWLTVQFQKEDPEAVAKTELETENRTETESVKNNQELRMTEPKPNLEEDIRITEATETEPETASAELLPKQTEGDLRLTEAAEGMSEPSTEAKQEDLSVMKTTGQETEGKSDSETQPDTMAEETVESESSAETEAGHTLTFEDDKIAVTATLPQEDATGMELHVEEIERGTKAYNQAYQAVKDTCELEEGQRLVYAPYKISLQEDGQPVSLAQPVKATVTYKTQVLDEQPEDEDAVFYAAVEGSNAKSVVTSKNDNTVTLALNGNRIVGPAAVLDTQPEELSTVTDMSGIKIEVLDGTQAVIASSDAGAAAISKVFDSQDAYTT